ncbi:type VII secretion protein EsaA [Bacillus glycinifermentans]|uniref:type VII secretion protein EsaA n=1 Tax=Bacillus glycinifermentans TaxID=1664069 RepID=UPI001FF22DC5|nr:type VII secretion protein EsaA [Bacillus glycinifermentans]UOY90554.1 type VII secretion protein EsaA [Bacillus glycinifermentans]
MTEQQKSSLKIISAVLVIILLPVLFFRFIGEDPTKKVSNETKEIAVVNEDIGSEQTDGNDQNLGRDMSAVLAERPDYKWTVVSRSTAESGLTDQKYDAIVYIPSDFTNNILSYNHKRPQKAQLEFRIQGKLDAVNKEKVQRELQDAQKTVSKKMTSFYWKAVKENMKGVRDEFDNIVDKESEFQNAMYNFYKPSSNNLAGEVEKQKDMIDTLKDSINQTKDTSKDRNAGVEETKKQLDAFIENVNQYKKYQEEQAKLLQAAQADSEKQIQTGLASINEKQASTETSFNQSMNSMNTAFGNLQQRFDLVVRSKDILQQYRYNQVPQQQFNGINTIENNLIDEYQAKTRIYNLDQIQPSMIDARWRLTEGTGDDSPGTDPGDDNNNDDNKDDDEEQPKDLKIDLQEQQDELKNVAAELKEISDGLKESPDNGSENPGDNNSSDGSDQNQDQGNGQTGDQGSDQTGDQDNSQTTDDNQTASETAENGQQEDNQPSEDPTNDLGTGDDGQSEQPGGETPDDQKDDQKDDEIAKLKEQLNNAAARIKKVEEDLRAKQETHNEELQKQLEKLDDKINSLNDTIKGLRDDIKVLEDEITKLDNKFDTMKTRITNMENNILSYLPDGERKEKLRKAFNSEIDPKKVNALLDYYNYLSIYEATLFNSLNPGNSVKQSAIAGQTDNVNTVLKVSVDENTKWEDLKNNMLMTSQDIENYKTGMTDFVDEYGTFIKQKQDEINNELKAISEKANVVSEQLSNPAGAGSAVMEGNATDGTVVLSMQDTLGNDILNLSDMLGALSEHQSGVINYTNNIQQSVNDVQTKADTLNSNWGKNVNSTKLIRGDVYSVLGNAFGGNDTYVYDHLANPVKISGDVPESKAQNIPPVVILVIVMISSLLIGYFSHHYQKAPLLVRGALFGILNIIVGLMISLFGLNVYSLADDQAIMWSIFTILLLVASSAIIRTAFMLGSIPGGVATAALILFYIAPLLDLAMPNFSINDPVSTVYMSIQYGTGDLFSLGIGALVLVTAVAIAIPFVISIAKSKIEESEDDYEE